VTVDHESLLTALSRLKLTAIRDQLDRLLDEAAKRELSLREALGFLVEREIARKDERRIEQDCPLPDSARSRRFRLCRPALARSAANPRTRRLPLGGAW
jgi:hypothetical protein